MKNLICNAFALKENFSTSPQLGGKAGGKMLEIYMKNIFVSLKSAKLHNPKDDVMLITNCAVPEEYEALFEKHGILRLRVPFERFVMPEEFIWALAYYKLCALGYVAECTAYDRILLMDADTVTTGSYEELWLEADYGLMLYPVGHSFLHKDRAAIREDYERIYPGARGSLIHYGGEFVCGSRSVLEQFVKKLEAVYNDMKERQFPVAYNAGDETVLSIAAVQMPGIIGAEAYIARYWTEEFYLVSTNTTANPVVIWHIPNEKKTGFVRLYRYYGRHGAFPQKEKLRRIFGMRRDKRPWNRYTWMNKIGGKLESIRSRRKH